MSVFSIESDPFNKIEIYLLYLGAHENFYKKMKEQRKIDVKFIKT